MKTYGNYSDLIDFTRNSSGTALRKISYGDELFADQDFNDEANWLFNTSAIRLANNTLEAVSGPSTKGAFYPANIENKVYRVTFNVVSGSGLGINNAWFAFADNFGGTSEGEQIGIDSTGEFTALLQGQSQDGFRFRVAAGTELVVDSLSIEEVLFDQPDGTLTLFNHPADIPRIEYDADGNVLGLLVEGSRTNLVTYSEDFNNAGWGTWGSGATITNNALEGPDGQLSMAFFEPLGNGGGVLDFCPVTGATNYTLSVFVKVTSGLTTSVGITLYESTVGSKGGCSFNFIDGVPVVASGTYVDSSVAHVVNGIYRLSVTVTSGSGSNNHGIVVSGNNVGRSFYAYGAQLEAGSFPTSYIPTSGATATRAADVAIIPVADVPYNFSEIGTFYVEFDKFSNESGPRSLTVVAAGNARVVDVNLRADNTVDVYSNHTLGGLYGLGTYSGGVAKTAATMRENDSAACLDGGSVVIDTTTTVPAKATYFNLGFYGANYLNGHIRSIKYYPRRLSNDQLQEITS